MRTAHPEALYDRKVLAGWLRLAPAAAARDTLTAVLRRHKERRAGQGEGKGPTTTKSLGPLFQHDVVMAMRSDVDRQSRGNFIDVVTFPAIATYEDWEGNCSERHGAMSSIRTFTEVMRCAARTVPKKSSLTLSGHTLSFPR
jgi:hypothetical protein